jgi:small subunit ribosomal protein S17
MKNNKNTNNSTAKPHRLMVKVVGNKRFEEGTLSVEREYQVKVLKYDKAYKMKRKMTVHCEEKKRIPIGTNVLIQQCRPISKTKSYIVVKIVSGGVEK